MPTYYVNSSSSRSPFHTRSRSHSTDGRPGYAQPVRYTSSHHSHGSSHSRYPSSSSSNHGYLDSGHRGRRHSNAGYNQPSYGYPQSYGNVSNGSHRSYGSHGSGGAVYHVQAPSSSRHHGPPPVQVIDARHHRSRGHSLQRDSGHHYSHHRRYSEPSVGERLKQFFGIGDQHHHSYGHRSTSTTRDAGRSSRSRSRRPSEYRDSRGRRVDESGRVVYQV